jgi:hypothetical protein
MHRILCALAQMAPSVADRPKVHGFMYNKHT